MNLAFPHFNEDFQGAEAIKMAADILSLVRGRVVKRVSKDSGENEFTDIVYDHKWLEEANERDIREVCKAVRYLTYVSDLKPVGIKIKPKSTDAEIIMLIANRIIMVDTHAGPDLAPIWADDEEI